MQQIARAQDRLVFLLVLYAKLLGLNLELRAACA
jgi:hypothetical protein